MDELLINRRYWYYRVRCVRQPAATGVHRQYRRHKSQLPAPPLDIQSWPALHTGSIVMKLCTVGDFGKGGAGGSIQFVPVDQYVYQQGMKKVFFFFYLWLLCMLLTQTKTVTAKPLLSMSLEMVCVHQDLRGL